MSVGDTIAAKLRGRFGDGTLGLKAKIFGVNNERIDFLMDSFYKLSPSQRMSVMGGLLGSVLVFLIMAVFFYFKQVGHLKREWDSSILALKELESNRQALEMENRAFLQMSKAISDKVSTVRIKSFLEAKSKEFKIQMDNVVERTDSMNSDDPLSETFSEVEAQVSFPKISLPKLVRFLVDLESSGNYLRIHALTIKHRHENKLYFDMKTTIKGLANK
jgi:hypothetical protein